MVLNVVYPPCQNYLILYIVIVFSHCTISLFWKLFWKVWGRPHLMVKVHGMYVEVKWPCLTSRIHVLAQLQLQWHEIHAHLKLTTAYLLREFHLVLIFFIKKLLFQKQTKSSMFLLLVCTIISNHHATSFLWKYRTLVDIFQLH